ncbi:MULTISPECIES: hypothetical protein [Oscillatoriales]|nr:MULTISPECIES: hypothetical protein [Oscillatoriales]
MTTVGDGLVIIRLSISILQRYRVEPDAVFGKVSLLTGEKW